MDPHDDKSKNFNPFRNLNQAKQSTEDTNVIAVQSPNSPLTSPLTLAQLENEIKFHLGQASQSIIEVGKRLLQAKSLVKHGEWQTWLENNFKLSYRTAKNFMDCAERFENMQSAVNLNQSQMAEMLILPSAEDTKKFIEQKAAEGTPVSDMTAKTIREEVKKWKNEKRVATKAKNIDAQPEPQKQSSTDEEKTSQLDLQSTPTVSTNNESLEQEPLAEEQSSTEAQEQNNQTIFPTPKKIFGITDDDDEAFSLAIKTNTITESVKLSPLKVFDNLLILSNELASLPDIKQLISKYANDNSEGFYSNIDDLFKIVDIIREIDNR